jgi:hypothetical protein
MRASTPSVQSKSHVLAGVQDAYWSDDENVSEYEKDQNKECTLMAGRRTLNARSVSRKWISLRLTSSHALAVTRFVKSLYGNYH